MPAGAMKHPINLEVQDRSRSSCSRVSRVVASMWKAADADQALMALGRGVTVPQTHSQAAYMYVFARFLPITLRPTYLTALLASTALLLAIVQWLCFVSHRDGGILFAENTNELPLSRSFSYLYLPTLISVIYGFLWTWVDLDIKRLEPYFQLSQPGGTTAGASILLSYPLEFLVTVPVRAFIRRHWQVFAGSALVILTSWGLVPTQAGLFAVRTITVKERIAGTHAISYTPLEQQGNLSSTYAQSVYNIAWLNETLPPFMTADYVLSSFGPSKDTRTGGINETYTGLTNLYSVDLACEDATLWKNSGIWYYNSTGGCSFYAPVYRPEGGNDTSKPYDTMYAGYQNQDGFASYYLSTYCNKDAFHLFFVRWSKARQTAILDNILSRGPLNPSDANATSLFCQATYYQQNVNATISLPSQSILDVQPTGNKTALPKDMFNVSTFEWAMNSGQLQVGARSDYPTTSFPNQQSQLANLPLNVAYLPKMAPFAIAADQLPLDEYLDAENLRKSYQSAYRLLFARQLTGILNHDLVDTTSNLGYRSYVIQAVVIVPAFAWMATGLLTGILLLGIYVLVMSGRRVNKLRADPATLGALMDLTAGDVDTIKTFAGVGEYSAQDLSDEMKSIIFLLEDGVDQARGDVVLRQVSAVSDSAESPTTPLMGTMNGALDRESRFVGEGIRPLEMKAVVGIIFFAVQIAASVIFAVLFAQSKKHNGLPLPSRSDFVRQLVENYLPIALATLVEPFWLVLNRLMCLLQPFEELRKSSMASSNAVDLDYSSLPPHFMSVRAFRAGQMLLGIVCLMTLLANALSVALSGLMYEGTVSISHGAGLHVAKAFQFGSLNGTAPPFNSDVASTTEIDTTSESFYRLMSNLTADTPLPAWSDTDFAYQAADLSGINENTTVDIDVGAVGATTTCRALANQGVENYTLIYNNDAAEAAITVHINTNEAGVISCTNWRPWTRSNAAPGSSYVANPQPGRSALELNAWLSSRKTAPKYDLFCRQHILAGWIRAEFEIIEGAELTYRGFPQMKAISSNETMLLCRPTIMTGSATIQADSKGQIHQNLGASTGPGDRSKFNTTEEDLVGQVNQFLVDSDATWHEDAYPSDYMNYLIGKLTNDTSMFNASLPNPSPEKAAKHFDDLYRRLFAILISTNADRLFENNTSSALLKAQVVVPETRILFSTPAFIVTEAILVCYMLTTIAFYFKRPWRILPRLPATVASNVAFFAASRALWELSARQRLDGSQDMKNVRASWTWGYGTFVGMDGRRHIGIERDPLVAVLQKSDLQRRTVSENKVDAEKM
ncbi:hypothetical protein DOTSEDRAFT_88953 [Dothistroma septosporum NZE10]|uniref:Uncharacterized protein n=1 Tax=Dothistroma septosporum (strain NZE10 / CBS 128990) TaxID=675120 RepID=M2Y3S2_DOTSN|nr:hypothetical protein DOTSEDRAFT_88953 [Dothistroma septosporum NZE10]